MPDRKLHIEQPAHPDALSDCEGCRAHVVDDVPPKSHWWKRAGRVAGVHTGFLDVLHDPTDVQLGAVVERVDINLDCIVEKAIDEQR